MAAWSELQTRRRLMSEYIRRTATGASGRTELQIYLKREVRVRNNTGGLSTESTLTLPPQVFGLMPFKRRQTDEKTLTAPSMGRDEVTDLQYLLIAPVDANVEANDWFDWGSDEHLRSGIYKVEYVAARHHDRKLVGVYWHAPRS